MKIYLAIIFGLFFFLSIVASGQNRTEIDSVRFDGQLRVAGRWQTGNLDQLSILPQLTASLRKKTLHSELNARYHYLKVGDFNAIDDFWINALLQIHPERRIYPLLTFTGGYARSYQIDHSVFGAGGIGLNLIKPTPEKFIQVQAILGYLDFQLEQEALYSSLASGIQIRLQLPLKDKFNLSFTADSYLELVGSELWGGSALLRLSYAVSRSFGFNLTYQTFYNERNASGIEKSNSLMMAGVQFNINNSSK